MPDAAFLSRFRFLTGPSFGNAKMAAVGLLTIAAVTMLAACGRAPNSAEDSGPSVAVPIEPVAPTSVDVPEWAKEAIWYQIFPERFANGDPANDPTADDLVGSWPHRRPAGWRTTPWNSDWYARAEWERSTEDNFYVTVQLRRYGGDIQGIIDRLPYLDSLGVTALYLNPVFESPSLHKYDGATWHHVDDNFGPDPAGDRRLVEAEDPVDPSTWSWTAADRLFLELIERVHERDMRIIIDGVFNHMGLRSFAFDDVRRRQQDSPYADWFMITAWDDPSTPDTSEFAYEGWAGVRELPEIREDERGPVAPVRTYISHSVRRWMDPNGDGDPSDGIDGWRLDVAEMVDLAYWREFRSLVRSINPDAYLVGEVWWENWSENRMHDASEWLHGDSFDAVMNYRWAQAARRWFIGADLGDGSSSYGSADFEAELTGLLEDYPPEVNAVLMNTYSSHDTDRLASQIRNPEFVFDHDVSPNADRSYDISAPDASDRALQRLMLVHQFTWIGAPHIYYGEEAGMWGADDPDTRKPMVWPDISHEPERSDPFGREREADPVRFDHDLHAWYRLLASIRSDHPALTRGSLRFVVHSGAGELVAYERRFGTDIVWVVINASADSVDAELEVSTRLPAAGHTEEVDLAGRLVRDAIRGEDSVLGDGRLSVLVPPMSASIWSPATLID